MHSSMICKNFAFQLDQQMLTSPDKNKESQSTAARYSQACTIKVGMGIPPDFMLAPLRTGPGRISRDGGKKAEMI